VRSLDCQTARTEELLADARYPSSSFPPSPLPSIRSSSPPIHAFLIPSAQTIIADIARKMGSGMADFAALSTPSQPVAEVQTLEHFSLYCHYVAGLVGEGLSRLFSSTGKERPWLKDQLVLSNSMALLLQKTNILRDIKEDVDDGRAFWPREVYADEKYGGGFKSVKELVVPANRQRAMWVLSTMTLDAIGHATDALDYLSLLKNQSVFNFCAIPAVMAMATLELCFMNPAVFERNVKIRKGQAVQVSSFLSFFVPLPS
jgi:farnesyl-diphosphate farnesyltransferase